MNGKSSAVRVPVCVFRFRGHVSSSYKMNGSYAVVGSSVDSIALKDV